MENESDNDNKKLFSLLKSHKIEKFIDIIKSSQTDYDLNIRDETSNYLITYVIIYNKLDILKILFEKGARIDVLDSEGRPILFYPIKYGYNDILDYLLDINKDNIGINIIDIKDKKDKISLHYAIQNKNIYAIKKLL